jgi:hypothetical protein
MPQNAAQEFAFELSAYRAQASFHMGSGVNSVFGYWMKHTGVWQPNIITGAKPVRPSGVRRRLVAVDETNHIRRGRAMFRSLRLDRSIAGTSSPANTSKVRWKDDHGNRLCPIGGAARNLPE